MNSNKLMIEDVASTIKKETIQEEIEEFIKNDLNLSNCNFRIEEFRSPKNDKERNIIIEFENEKNIDSVLKNNMVLIDSKVFQFKQFNFDNMFEKKIIPILSQEQTKTNKENLISYKVDSLTESQYKILLIENYPEICKREVDSNLKIQLKNQIVFFNGKWESIEISKSKLWDIVHSIKEKAFSHKRTVLEFLINNKNSIENILYQNKIRCILEKPQEIDFKEANEFILIKSFSEESINECSKFIKANYITFSFELDENAAKLSKKFNKFLQTNTIDPKRIKVILAKENVVCTGEKQLVDSFSQEAIKFFEKNTIYTKDLTDQFDFEQLKYFEKVVYDSIDNLNKQVRNELDVEHPFELEIKINNKNFNIDFLSLKITANQHFHNVYLNLLKNLLDNKIIEEYSLKTRQAIDLFEESRTLSELKEIENSKKCVILTPKHVNLIKNLKNQNEFSVYYSKAKTQVKLTAINVDITKFNKADLMVVYQDKYFKPIDKKSNFILEKAGHKVINELKMILNENNNQVTIGQAYYTSSGNLKNFKGFLHCVISESKNFNQAIYQCLLEGEFRNFKKIAFNIYEPIDLPFQNLINFYLDSIRHYFDFISYSEINEIFFIDSRSDKIFDLFKEKSQIKSSNIFMNVYDDPIETDSVQTKEIINDKLIEIVYGSIIDDSLDAEAIINTTSRNLKLNSGYVSTIILNAAGYNIQNELENKYPNGLSRTEVAITSAGKLKNKKWIIHLALSTWDDSKSDKIKNRYKETIFSVLRLAEDKKIKSIAFPSLGTGNLKYPKELVPKLMFKYVREYFSNSKTKSIINKIYFVIYHDDSETIKAFKAFNDKSSYDDYEIVVEDDSVSSYSNLKKTNNECSIDINGINLRVYIGNITDSSTDFIFNPTNNNLDTSGSVSKALLNLDSNLQNELEKLKSNFNTIGVTPASGSLKCKNIIHVAFQLNNIDTCVLDSLIQINKLGNSSSVTFPVIGTGNHQSEPSSCCNKIIDGIIDYTQNNQNKKQNIKRIEICIYIDQKDYLEYFIKKIEKLNEKDKNKPSGFINTIKSLLGFNTNKSFQTEKPKEKLFTEESFKFKLISNSKSSIESVKQSLEELSDKEICISEYTDDYFLELDSESKKEIEKICEDNLTKVTFKASDKISISGRHKNIAKSIFSIMKLVSNHLKFKETKIIAEVTSQKVEWQFKENNKWISFNMFLNNEIEKKFQKFVKTPDSEDYQIQLVNEKNSKFIADVKNYVKYMKISPDDKTEIRRIDIEKTNINFKYPSSWDISKQLNLITLSKDDDEFKNIQNLINNTGLNSVLKKIVDIQRVQNKHLYIQYLSYKNEIENKNNNSQVEKILFHGTSEDCVENIWKTGFNRSYAGKNATAYGRGVYFARDSSYSHHYTDINKGKTKGHMFIAKVLISQVTLGTSNVSVPANNSDTTVDNVANPSIFVIYKDAQAYPEYLLTYE